MTLRGLGLLPANATANRSPLGPKESHGSPAPMNDPPEQTVRGMGVRCQFCPPSNETAAMMSWNDPWIHAATKWFGRVGFTATTGSTVSATGHVPNPLKPVSQPPTALGREISTSGPRVWAAADPAIGPASTSPIVSKQIRDWRLIVSLPA